MNTYWFDVEVAGPVTENDVEVRGDVLSGSCGIDATVQADERGGIVMFSREADDAFQAVISAVRDVEAAGLTVTGIAENGSGVRDH